MKKRKYKLRVNYDRLGDVLYVSLYDPARGGIGYEAGPGMVVRKSPVRDEVIGFTILDFKERFIDNEESVPKIK